MKLILIGSTGTLGRAMRQVFPHAVCPKREVWRQALHLQGEAGDIVLNCAGQIDQNLPFAQLQEPNCDLPKSIYETCSSKGLKLIHFSSDCVFDGQAYFTSAHREDSGPVSQMAATAYGRSKLLGEELLWRAYDHTHNLVVIRSSFVGPGNPLGLFEVLGKAEELPGYLNSYWNGLTSLELANTIDKILRNAGLADLAFRKGLLHLFSPHIVSKYELLAWLNKDVFWGMKMITPTLLEEPVRRQLGTIHDEFYKRLNIPHLIDQIADPDFERLRNAPYQSYQN